MPIKTTYEKYRRINMLRNEDYVEYIVNRTDLTPRFQEVREYFTHRKRLVRQVEKLKRRTASGRLFEMLPDDVLKLVFTRCPGSMRMSFGAVFDAMPQSIQRRLINLKGGPRDVVDSDDEDEFLPTSFPMFDQNDKGDVLRMHFEWRRMAGMSDYSGVHFVYGV
jgi:hypothetical protein